MLTSDQEDIEYTSIGINEASELLEGNPNNESKESWWQWSKGKLKSVGIGGLALATAFPNFINGTMARMNAPAKEFINPAWWRSLSASDLTLTILNGGSALLINVLLNLFFLPLAAKKFHYNITHFNDHPVRNTIAIIYGVMGAVGAGAIALDAFNLFPGTLYGEIFASAAALINFIIYVATRYVGVANAMEKFFNLFDKDLTTQTEFADLLDHIKPEYRPILEGEFLRIAQPILSEYDLKDNVTQADVEHISLQLMEALKSYAEMHPDLFADKTKLELFLHGLGIFFDLTLAFTIFPPITLTFMQAGFNGVRKLTDLIAGDKLTAIDIWFKRLIGIMPGSASGALYTVSNLEMRSALMLIIQNLYHDPSLSHIAFALALIVTNVFSTSSMLEVAENVVKNPDNIAFVSNNTYGEIYKVLNQVGGFGVNFNASAKQLYAPKDLGTAASLANMEGYKKILHKGNDHRLSHETIEELRQYRFFNPPASQPNSTSANTGLRPNPLPSMA